MESLQRCREICTQFEAHPERREAYYYKRAWARTWGLFNASKEAQRIFELCDNASLEAGGDFTSIISTFLEEWSKHYPQAREYQTLPLSKRMSHVEAAPLYRKLDYPYYLQVTLLYTGSSRQEGGNWISMVEHRLEWLKSSECTLLPYRAP